MNLTKHNCNVKTITIDTRKIIVLRAIQKKQNVVYHIFYSFI